VQILARCVIPRSAMTFIVGTKVRFIEKYRPPQVRWGTIGTIVDVEERPAPNSGSEYWGPRSLRRLHHALDRGVEGGAGELRLIPRSPSGPPR
jgi:hypothetical protein